MIDPPPATAPTATSHDLRLQLSSTRRGARLARLLVEQQLEDWGLPRTATVTRTVVAVTAELAANAVTHGHTPGRDFEVRLLLSASHVRIEVSDTRPDRLPPPPGALGDMPDPDVTTVAESGRGLLLTETLADRWGCDRRDQYVKTVWAECDRTPPSRQPLTQATSQPQSNRQ
ncbi:ATP-binding protein [Streptomyces collinus]|uniref:ATP-binding protein n=1 Tax=Streptomyces collinus TaxID=42684 RepID=UPI003427AB26